MIYENSYIVHWGKNKEIKEVLLSIARKLDYHEGVILGHGEESCIRFDYRNKRLNCGNKLLYIKEGNKVYEISEFINEFCPRFKVNLKEIGVM